MTAVISEISSTAASLVTNVGLAVVAGLSVGALILGARRAWGVFKSMAK